MNQTAKPDHPLPVPADSITDLYLAAALATAGLVVSRIDRRDGRAVFVFAADDRLPELVQRYYRGALSVDARGFADTVRALKSAIHSAPVGAL